MMEESPFRERIQALLNENSMENGSNTPDFILAQYLVGCLQVFDTAVTRRDKWYGVELVPGAPVTVKIEG